MTTATKDFIQAWGFNSDPETVNMLMREAKSVNIIEAIEVFPGTVYRLILKSGDSRIINDGELIWLCSYVQGCTDGDFYIKNLDGSVTTAVS